MERKEFLEKCEELGFWIEKVIDLGSLVHGHDADHQTFRDFSEEIYGIEDETLSFLNVGHFEDFEAEDEDDAEALFNEALFFKIHQSKKFGLICRLNVPFREYISYGFRECVGVLDCPCFYAETMEDLYLIAVDRVLKLRAEGLRNRLKGDSQ
jgi:hypothetical protein